MFFGGDVVVDVHNIPPATFEGGEEVSAVRNNAAATVSANGMSFNTLSGYRKTYLAARGETAIPGVSPTYDA